MIPNFTFTIVTTDEKCRKKYEIQIKENNITLNKHKCINGVHFERGYYRDQGESLFVLNMSASIMTWNRNQPS